MSESVSSGQSSRGPAISHAASSEKELSFEGFICPTKLVNDFTPDQFEEMVTIFRKFDLDGSLTIDLTEIVKMLEELDMTTSAPQALHLLESIDKDNSGEIDFDEFCDLFSRLARGDKELKGFDKLTAALNETPISILLEQCRKRNLLTSFKLLEERPASSMHAAHYVVEAVLTGIWYDRDKDGKTTKFNGSKCFQGIGKSTRDAKFKSASLALKKLLNNMPGLAHQLGELPDIWLKWAHENLEKGVDESKVLKGLIDKGFVPAMNTHLMQSMTVMRHIRYTLKENPLLLVGEEVGDVGDVLDAFLDEHLRLGFDGTILLQTLEQFGFEVERNPTLVHRLRRQEVSVGSGIHVAPALEPMTPATDKFRDFFRACKEGALDEVELYILAAQPIDQRRLTANSQGKTGLIFAAQAGHRMVVRLLLQHHADPNSADALGRSAMHYAAMEGHTGCIEELDRFGGDLHLMDAQHNTPLHLACKKNKFKSANKLYEMEEDYQRRCLTGAIPAVEGKYAKDGATLIQPIAFTDLCYQVFSEFIVSKNHKKDLPRFRKDWIYEACLWVYDHFSQHQRRFVSQPNLPVVEYILSHKDPHKGHGFYMGIRSKEMWVKTCDSHEDAFMLITECFRMAACHCLNKLGRTPLHEACFENKVDSHGPIIDMMINKHFQNLEIKDIHGRRALDELILRRGRPGSPTVLDIKERLTYERRDNWVSLMYQERATHRKNLADKRKADILEQCSKFAFNLSKSGWQMVKTASQPMYKVDPYLVYEDVDALNFFYVKRSWAECAGGVHLLKEDSQMGIATSTQGGADGAVVAVKDRGAGSSIGSNESSSSDSSSDSDSDSTDDSTLNSNAEENAKKIARRDKRKQKLIKIAQKQTEKRRKQMIKEEEELKIKYNWFPPPEYIIRLKLLFAIDSMRNRCIYLRTCQGWDMVKCTRLNEIWYCKPDSTYCQFTTPLECRFENILKNENCEQKGVLGAKGKWIVIQDPDGNIFYLNKKKAYKTSKRKKIVEFVSDEVGLFDPSEPSDSLNGDNSNQSSASTSRQQSRQANTASSVASSRGSTAYKFDIKLLEWDVGSFGVLDARWEKPADAVRWENGGPLSAATILNMRPTGAAENDDDDDEDPNNFKPIILEEGRCTRFLGGNKPLNQIWYSCEALTEELRKEAQLAKEDAALKKAEDLAQAGSVQAGANKHPSPFAKEDYSDRFRCCGPCFRKLMRATAQVTKMVGEKIPTRRGHRYENTLIKELNDPNHKILGGYGVSCKTLKFVKSSKIICSVMLLPGLEPAGVGIAKAANEVRFKAKLVDEEIIRHETKRLKQPCILANVPSVYPPSKHEGKLREMIDLNTKVSNNSSKKKRRGTTTNSKNTKEDDSSSIHLQSVQSVESEGVDQLSELRSQKLSLSKVSLMSKVSDHLSTSSSTSSVKHPLLLQQKLKNEQEESILSSTAETNSITAAHVTDGSLVSAAAKDQLLNPKKIRSWHLCRMRKDSQPLFGWIPCHDPEPGHFIEPGTRVRAKKINDEYGWHLAIVKQRRGNDYYDLAFSSKEVRYKTPRSEIDDDGDVFWFNAVTGKSQWKAPDEVYPFEQDRMRRLKQQEDELENKKKGKVASSSSSSSAASTSSSNRRGSVRGSIRGGGKGNKNSSAQSQNNSSSQGASDNQPTTNTNFNIDDVFTLKFHDKLKVDEVSWPWYSGNDFEEFIMRCGFKAHRLDIAGWDEYVDPETGCCCYRNIKIHEKEQAARLLQRLSRCKKNFPLLEFWESIAYTFDTPPEVLQACYERGGWALLKRRSKLLKNVIDDADQPWAQYLDNTVSKDVFYYETEPNKAWSTWNDPLAAEEVMGADGQIIKETLEFSEFDSGSVASRYEEAAMASDASSGGGGGGGGGKGSTHGHGEDGDILKVDDKVLFRYVESPDMVLSVITGVHIDPKSDEYVYDLHEEGVPDRSMKSVPRFAIVLPEQSVSDRDQEKQVKNLITQLRRAREAEARRIEQAQMEEAEAQRRKRRGPGAPKARELIPMSVDEVLSYREERAAHEKRNYENYLAMELERKEKEAANSVLANLNLKKRNGDDGGEGDEDGSVGKGNKWVERAGIGSFLGMKGKLAREHKRQLEENELKKKEDKKGKRSGINSKKEKRSRDGQVAGGPGSPVRGSSRRSRRVKASREASRSGRLSSGLGGGSGSDDNSVRSGENHLISSDEGSEEDEDAGPPMSVEDEAALKEAREKMERQRKERVAARLADRAECIDRENWLAEKEDGMSSPRTVRRRVVHRNLYRALLRMKDSFTICRWGCGLWMREGHQEFIHQRDLCPKRIIQCALKCPCRMREEQWLEPYQPPKDVTTLHGGDEDDSDKSSVESDDSDAELHGWGDASAKKKFTSNSLAFAMEGMNMINNRMDTVQKHHEKHACPRRLVRCKRRCGEWVHYEDLSRHLAETCVKRPFPPLQCRLGCGLTFSGGVHRMVACEEDRLEHESEVCEFRTVRCTWKGCAATFPANQRTEHRRKHINASGVISYTVPGNYKYKVESGVTQLQIQLWGGGGGGGGLKNQTAGSGGGGAFVEALVKVREGEALEITVGGGGGAGCVGTEVMTEDPNDPSATHVEEIIGQAIGGFPGGGHGHSSNTVWAAGGGGGYSMVQRKTGGGSECILVAGGGGGAGSCDGVPGGTEKGELPGMRLDKLNGRMGSDEHGGSAGDSGEGLLCSFGSEVGKSWQGGNGASFGGGGGGGYFGGGGGGVAPGIVGAGGGGSSYANKNICKDVVFLQGDGWKPGGFDGSPNAIKEEEMKLKDQAMGLRPKTPANVNNASATTSFQVEITEKCNPGYNLPRATGSHELDLLDGYIGEGGKASLTDWQAGKNGCVRIKRPGFYKDYDPNQFAKDYVGLPRHQEVLLPMGIPVANVLEQAEQAHKERLELFH